MTSLAKAEMTDEEKEENDKEYKALLALFIAMLKNLKDNATVEESLEALATLRMQIAMNHAFDGFKIDREKAIQLLKSVGDNNITKLDKEKRDRLVAAMENLADFSVAEEYQVFKKAMETYDMYGEDDIDFNDEDMMEEYEEICELYNKRYAFIENKDIEYSMGVALWWVLQEENVYLTYMTQNDDRVRPWHFVLQGFTARKRDFPEWMIPPIEWGCRCFLESSDGGIYAHDSRLKYVNAEIKPPKKPEELDDVFSESVAKCGKIFGKSHPYFDVDKKDVAMLKRIAKNIKSIYYGK